MCDVLSQVMFSQHFTCFHVSQLVCVYTITGGRELQSIHQITTPTDQHQPVSGRIKQFPVMLATTMNGKRGKSGECECAKVQDIVKYTHTWGRCITHNVLRVRWYTRLLPSMVIPWDTTVTINSLVTLPSPSQLMRSVKLLLFEDLSAVREWEQCWKLWKI